MTNLDGTGLLALIVSRSGEHFLTSDAGSCVDISVQTRRRRIAGRRLSRSP
jgi:hypothetical protein